MAIVKQNQSTEGTTSGSYVLSFTPTQGRVLVGFFCNLVDSTTITAMTQTGVTWTFIGRYTRTVTCTIEVWYGVVGSSPSATISTITWSSTGAGKQQHQVSEFSGVDTVSPLDGSAVTSGVFDASVVSTGSYTSTNANDLIIAGWAQNSVAETVSSGPTNSFTSMGFASAGNGGNVKMLGAAYQIVSATGTYSTAWTMSGSVNPVVLIVGLKATAVSIPNRVYVIPQAVNRAARY